MNPVLDIPLATTMQSDIDFVLIVIIVAAIAWAMLNQPPPTAPS